MAIMLGGAVHHAANQVRDKLMAIAAHRLGVAASTLEYRNGGVEDPASGRAIEWIDLVTLAHRHFHLLPPGMSPGIAFEHIMQVPTGEKLPTADGRVQMYPCYSFEFHVVLVAIDPEIGKPEIRRYVIGHDCGTVINPDIVRGMTLGGIAHGIGAALLEEFAFDGEGQLVAQSFMDYLLPSAHEVPEVEIVHHVTPSPHTVLGQKGSGESGYLGSPAALSGAINDAVRHLNIRFESLPMRISAIGDAIAEATPPPCRNRAAWTPTESYVCLIIDSHAHLVPPALLEAIRSEAARFPSVRAIEDHGSLAFSFAGAKPTRPVSKPLADIAGRVAWMTKNGIDKQVVGGWVDMFGYELPAAEGTAWAQLINTHLAEAAKAEPRFVPLATVPLQDGAAAAEVLRAAIAAGFPGVMIGTLPRGVGSVLDAPDLAPFWQAADDTGAVVHIHPSFDAGDVRVNDYGLANAVGRITDALIAVSRLISAGHVARYAKAKIVVPMGSAGLPFLLGRLARNHAITPGLGDPAEALRHIYTDTILHDPRVLRFVVDMVGADRIMLGSDMPFPIGDTEPGKIVQSAGLSAADAASITGGLARTLFRL